MPYARWIITGSLTTLMLSGCSVDDTTAPTHTLRASSSVTSAAAPTTLPTYIQDDSSYISAAPYWRGRILQQSVLVLFDRAATHAQRDSAVQRVNATTVGGSHVFGSDGYYLLRLPSPGVAAVFTAIDTLETLPGVAVALPVPDHGLEMSHLTPNDTLVADWQLNPLDASGRNWGMEAIAAPLAWGCSVGSPAVKIGIVDKHFVTAPDVAPNIEATVIGDAALAVAHGTRVASLVAARGDNTQGMAGVAWYAGLRRYDMLTLPSQPTESMWPLATVSGGSWPFQLGHIFRAAADGVVAVNVSTNITSDTLPDQSPELLREAAKFSEALVATLRQIDDAGLPMPLIVFSAGNNKADAGTWSGVAAAKAAFPNHVLIVGAIDSLYQTGRSNTGPDVDLYAPGIGVLALAGDNVPVVTSGTSFAAPLVTGTAALLKAFDPRLTVADIRALILAGAARSRLPMVNGKYVLDAYEALRAAARRPGAPLCGNRLWAEAHWTSDDGFTGRLVVQRSTSPSMQETLYEAPWTEINHVGAFHGGRGVFVDPSYDDQLLSWNPSGTWSLSPIGYSVWDSLSSSTDLSRLRLTSHYNLNHDGDSVVAVWDEEVTAGTWRIDVRVGTLGANDVPEDPYANPLVTSFHWTPTPSPATAVYTRATFSSAGDAVFVAVSSMFNSALFRIPLGSSSPTPQLVLSFSDSTAIWGMQVSEDDQELMLVVGSHYQAENGSYLGFNPQPCRFEWRSVDNPTTVFKTVQPVTGWNSDPIFESLGHSVCEHLRVPAGSAPRRQAPQRQGMRF